MRRGRAIFERMRESVDVLVVGAGHAGLAMPYFLTHEGRDHVVLERRDSLGGGWQDRWDEFTLVTPNWTPRFRGGPTTVRIRTGSWAAS